MSARSREYALAHREVVAERNRERYFANLEENRQKRRAYALANADAAKERARKYYWANREKVLARMASEPGRAYSRAKMRERVANSPSLRVHSNVSRAIRSALAGKGNRSWEALVGYSRDVLARHLQRQFTRGMEWNNYGRGAGRWHIDHIVPRIEFQFETADDAEFRACWALTNLRPLWGDQNISKHAKRMHLL